MVLWVDEKARSRSWTAPAGLPDAAGELAREFGLSAAALVVGFQRSDRYAPPTEARQVTGQWVPHVAGRAGVYTGIGPVMSESIWSRAGEFVSKSRKGSSVLVNRSGRSL